MKACLFSKTIHYVSCGSRSEGLCWKEWHSLPQLSLHPDGRAATYVVAFQHVAGRWLRARTHTHSDSTLKSHLVGMRERNKEILVFLMYWWKRTQDRLWEKNQENPYACSLNNG